MSKQLHEEEQEYFSVEMTMRFYEEHIEPIKSDEVRIKSAYAKRNIKKDAEYKRRLDALIEAKYNLLEHEVKMNYKRLLNIKK
jgi:hypothetical protein